MADNSGTPFAESGGKKVRIEIVPLIDVIFFLLATFVLFTLSLNKIQSMEAKLPVPSPNPIQNEQPPLTLQVSSGNTVFVDRDPTDMADIRPRLTQYKQSQESSGKAVRVLITGDDGAKYGNLIKVLDLTKSVGITEISLETAYRESGK